MAERLPPHQYALLAALARAPEGASIEQLAATTGLDQALVSAAGVELSQDGLVAVDEHRYSELKLGELGAAIQRGEAVLEERLIARAVRERGGEASIKDLSADPLLQEAGIQPGKFAKGLVELGWAEFAKGTLKLASNAADDPPACDLEVALTAVHVAGGTLMVDEHSDPRILAGAMTFKGRKTLLTLRERSRKTVRLLPPGEELARGISAGEVVELLEVNELTPEMLADGSWREVQFRPYNVSLAAERSVPGKAHPLARIVERTRLAFFELGFTEVSCPMAEAAFWDFDALFQPQDHPAREMQDTFYCKSPAAYPLPADDVVERVRQTHEDGGNTGSRGWRYGWSAERAAQVVLRTHMTTASIEAIARDPRPPQKIFSIGRVFRRETVDFKHLPEFMQVDGIIIDEQATFASLLGTLAAFYERMGIPKVRFKPDFFPYTEPSVGVQIWWGGDWFEMGGAGIFRPEVTLPFGCSAPVLAWGLGLERLAMARLGVAAMKDLYQTDLDWLKAVPLEG